MSVEEMVFPIVAILLLGVAKGGFGGVGAPVALPVMSMGLPVETAIGVLLPVLLTIDVVNVSNYRKNADYKTIALGLPGALVGVGIGSLLIYTIPSHVVGFGVGVIAIFFAIHAMRQQIGSVKGLPRWMALPFGMASGFTSSLAHAGGPPIHIYLLSRGYEQIKFVATANMFMASVNVLKVVPFLATGTMNLRTTEFALWLLPAAALAAVLGYFIAKVLPKPMFKIAVNSLMIIAGCKLILDSFL